MPHSPVNEVTHDDYRGAGIVGSDAHHDQTNARPKPRQPAKRRRRVNKAGAVEDSDDEPKRRVVTTACIACRKRKSKCDGNTPACAACSQVYGTACIYDPLSDHRRKGVYKNDLEELKTKESTLRTIVQAILNYAEEDVPALVRHIRTCDSLDDVAESIASRNQGLPCKDDDEDEEEAVEEHYVDSAPTFESKLGQKMGELRLDDGSVRYIGGTSHLLFLNGDDAANAPRNYDSYVEQQANPVTSWTNVTSDPELITHLLNLYFTWHYSYFTCLSRSLFYRDFLLGQQPEASSKTQYCTPLLVNAMLALGCHFTNRPAAREDPDDALTAGQQFFREAKRLLLENDEHEKPRIATVQALALMSVREAGCGREARGWVYSGMSFRMALDLGLHLDSGALAAGRDRALDEGEEDARRITFWGCFLFDKCWSNYMGRLPQLPKSMVTCPLFDVFPDEDAGAWAPYGDSGALPSHLQPARTRAVSLHITGLCDISGDLMRFFYNPGEQRDVAKAKGKQAELKKLSEIEIRLESWRKSLPKEMEAREGCLPSVFIMHMFFQLLFIHLFRPFLQYTASTSPLPPTVSPRKLCTTAATTISRLLRLYKRSYGLRQICNICIYIIHTACTIHLLNLPEKDAKRDIVYGVKHLEEIAESWPGARRTLTILGALARQWQVELPDEAAVVLQRCELKFADDVNRSSASPAMLQPVQSHTLPPLPEEGVYHPMPQPSVLEGPRALVSAHSHGSDHDIYWDQDTEQGGSMHPSLHTYDNPMSTSPGQATVDFDLNSMKSSDLYSPLPQSVTELLESLIPQQQGSMPAPPMPIQSRPAVNGNLQRAGAHIPNQSPQGYMMSPLDRHSSTSAASRLSTPGGQSGTASRGAPGLVALETAAIDHQTTSSAGSLPHDSGTAAAAAATAASRSSRQPSAVEASTGQGGVAAAGGIPDIFGGVEQLLRDVSGNNAGSEWMLRDQSALAWGFGNWDLGGEGGTYASSWAGKAIPQQQQQRNAPMSHPASSAGGSISGAATTTSVTRPSRVFAGGSASLSMGSSRAPGLVGQWAPASSSGGRRAGGGGGGDDENVDMDLDWLR